MIEPNKGPTWPTSEFDHLPIGPDGKKVGQTDNAELTARLERLGVEGFSHSAGRQSNIEKFAAAHQRVYDEAGRAAVALWLARGGS